MNINNKDDIHDTLVVSESSIRDIETSGSVYVENNPSTLIDSTNDVNPDTDNKHIHICDKDNVYNNDIDLQTYQNNDNKDKYENKEEDSVYDDIVMGSDDTSAAVVVGREETHVDTNNNDDDQHMDIPPHVSNVPNVPNPSHISEHISNISSDRGIPTNALDPIRLRKDIYNFCENTQTKKKFIAKVIKITANEFRTFLKSPEMLHEQTRKTITQRVRLYLHDSRDLKDVSTREISRKCELLYPDLYPQTNTHTHTHTHTQ
eukprot:GHVR01050239.1.p1 GENE.GHVR01050239.1~~GHVR01050239.1.p1  ORF type:complete len:277 (-),score=104.57 GHVR01050239.1:63-845(-)